MIILTFDPSQQQPPRTGVQSLDGIRLVPGKNVISPADWQKLQTHAGFADLLEQGAVFMHELDPSHLVDAPADEPEVVEVIDPTKSDPELSDLSALKIAESEPLIEATDDIDLLTTWRDADDRKGIKELISDRLRQLSPPL